MTNIGSKVRLHFRQGNWNTRRSVLKQLRFAFTAEGGMGLQEFSEEDAGRNLVRKMRGGASHLCKRAQKQTHCKVLGALKLGHGTGGQG